MALRTANVVGSGPNGLAAAITLAQRGVAVTVFERNPRIGGACSTAEVTLPGFRHDLGSSVYPMGVASPFLRSLPLHEFGLRWVEPEVPLAHPFDDGTAALLTHSLEETAAQFGPHDQRAWRALVGPSVRDWNKLADDILRPLLRVPSSPVAMAFFGMAALLPAGPLARSVFRSPQAQALFGGCAGHSVLPLNKVGSAAVGLVLAAATHTTGWPFAAGGAQSLTDAMADYLRSLGGKIETDAEINTLAQLPPVDVTLFDTGVAAFERIAGSALTPSFRTRLCRFRRGPGTFKVDWALREPIPWKAAACRRAGTVHVGGSLAEIEWSEYAAFYGYRCERPLVLVTQPSVFDASRAPEGKHTAWGYCHVPAALDEDMTDIIEAHVERFAPGFRDCILARKSWSSEAFESWNPNLAGGDLSGGAMTLPQLIARPTLRGYRSSDPRLYLCSASTPPGGGVHGMCGQNAALAALRDYGA